MADATPNYKLERKKAEVQIGQMRQNILASELREMQLEAELDQVRTNIASSEKAIADQQAIIDSLPADS